MSSFDENLGVSVSDFPDGPKDSSGGVKQEDSSLGKVLKQIVSNESSSIYCETQMLYDLLTNEEHNIDSPTAYKVCMLASVPGFSDLAKQKRKVMQSDINRIITSAQRVTKLDRLELLAIMHDIFVSIDPSLEYDGGYELRTSGDTGKEELVGYVVPYSVYRGEIETVEDEIEKIFKIIKESEYETGVHEDSEPYVSENVLYIKRCLGRHVQMGIPKAKYLMGRCMLNGLMGEDAQAEGRKLIEEAAAAGNPDALAELGDACYSEGVSADDGLRDQWNRAYALYTGYGSLALTDERRENLSNILAHGSFNNRTMLWSAVLLACMIGVILWGFTFTTYNVHAAWGIIAIALSCTFMVRAWIQHGEHPYGDSCFVPVGLFVVWSLYMFSWFFC